MKITSAELRQFRSYEACALEPCEGVNVLLGDNGQGKTNVLEALYLCCTGRSHRTRQDRDMIRWGVDFAAVRVDTLRRDGSHRVEIALPAAGRRKIKVSGQEIARSGELMGKDMYSKRMESGSVRGCFLSRRLESTFRAARPHILQRFS